MPDPSGKETPFDLVAAMATKAAKRAARISKVTAAFAAVAVKANAAFFGTQQNPRDASKYGRLSNAEESALFALIIPDLSNALGKPVNAIQAKNLINEMLGGTAGADELLLLDRILDRAFGEEP